MVSSLDLNLLPIARFAGKEYPDLLAVHAELPPRHPERTRSADRLIFYLVIEGNASIPISRQNEILAELAKLYFSSPGTVTAGLRRVAVELNHQLLDRNMNTADQNQQGLGWLAQIALHEKKLFVGLSGPFYAYLISENQNKSVFEPDFSELRLGQVEDVPITFHQVDFQANDTLLVAALPSPAWDSGFLSGLFGQGPESIRRRLFSSADPDLNALLIQAKAGKGNIYLPRPIAHDSSEHIPASPPTPIDEVNKVSTHPAKSKPEVTSPTPKKPKSSLQTNSSRNFLAAFILTITNSLQKVGRGIRIILGRILPEEALLSIPTSLMAFLALAVPVVVVSVASVAYFRLGRDVQYENLLSQARQMATHAIDQNDVQLKRAELEAALQVIEKAEHLRITQETQDLHVQLRNALDDLGKVDRLDFQPAIIGGLPTNVNITRMVAADTDLYLLDENSGEVLRASGTDQGYAIDQTFQCGPESIAVDRMGKLKEITSWPAGLDPKATIVAFDENWNALFCQPEETPVQQAMVSPTEQRGKLAAFAMEPGQSYALEAISSQLWVYGQQNFDEIPEAYFDGTIPLLQDVSSLGVNRSDTYFLHKDGHLTYCYQSTFQTSPTQCEIKAYKDARPGLESMDLVPPSPFTQMLISPPPEPLILMLEAKNHAIYLFSLKNLILNKLYLPGKPLLPTAATSFTINPTLRHLFLAIGNNVYHAALP